MIIDFDRIESKTLTEEFPVLYSIIISVLDAYEVSTDYHYYNYLNSEYDMRGPVACIFHVDDVLDLHLIINWILQGVFTTHLELLDARKNTKDNRKKISEILMELFTNKELEFLRYMNIIWQDDLKEYGYVTEENFNVYLNLTDND